MEELMIRNADINDLDFLTMLEKNTFPEYMQSSRRSLRLSINSPFQEVLIIEEATLDDSHIPVGAAVLQIYTKTLRVYSVSVLPDRQHLGYGRKLMTHIENMAKSLRCNQITLEADAGNGKLISWYESFGFIVTGIIPDYYATGKNAVKMVFPLGDDLLKHSYEYKIKNLVVVDKPVKWLEGIETIEIIKAKDYITDIKYHDMNCRVFNLCCSYKYQSTGYYVSLLASARDRRVIPNVATMRDLTDKTIIQSISQEEDEEIQNSLRNIKEKRFAIKVYFGRIADKKYEKLARRLYALFEAPFLKISFLKNDRWIIDSIVTLSINAVTEDEIEVVKNFACDYFKSKRFNRRRLKNFKYDLAVLIDPNEKMPPSCPIALKKFKKAGEDTGFYVEFITKKDYHRMNEYDALFIRETTKVNDHTYEFSRYAYAEGLVVIDDPWSILRCSNKLFLYEKMTKAKVLMPKSCILIKGSDPMNQVERFMFPIVLKQPDSAFSKGVHKVDNRNELEIKLKELFKTSEMVVAQEFLKSDFDWRIGVLDNKPLYACKYFMAKNHWQIINWDTVSIDSGDFETLPVEKVPEPVLDLALKAASQIGNGLYGVDIKEINGQVYLIEVNDNPSIDAGIEDLVLGDILYLKIMQFIYDNIEKVRNNTRYV